MSEEWRPSPTVPTLEFSSDGPASSEEMGPRPGSRTECARVVTAEHTYLALEARSDGTLRVPSDDGSRLVVLRPFIKLGHPHVVIGLRQVRVAQLVLECFLSMRILPLHIRYRDGDPANVALDNLQYGQPPRPRGRPRRR